MKQRVSAILVMAACSLTMTGQTIAADSAMRAEADAFLQHLPEGLQHRQTLAVDEAVGGDHRALNAVRNSRNAAPVISPDVKVSEPAPSLRLYEPSSCDGKSLPLLIYLHGGGWTFGSLNSCARFCDALASMGGVKVLAVDYRLAPEHSFPNGLDDCTAAVAYALAHADTLGIDTARVSVGGDSSGGNLALAASLSASCRGRLSSLVLFYPVTKAFADGSASWQKYGEGYGLDAELMEAFNRAYCTKAEPRDPRISVGLNDDEALKALPPTLLVAAGRDILCDQGSEFARRAADRVRRVEFPGAVHLFITVGGQDAAFRKAVALTHEFLVGAPADE